MAWIRALASEWEDAQAIAESCDAECLHAAEEP
jgi:hypothetical protein